MRVITAQSPEVWQILLREGVYHPSLELAREPQDYTEDIKQCDGNVPIWCYAYPEITFVTCCTGDLLESLRSEMCLGQEGCWDNFLLLEVEVPVDKLHKGKAHNDCIWCQVFGVLTLRMVRAVYRLRDSVNTGWYHKVVTPVFYVNPLDCISCREFDTSYWDVHDETAPTDYFRKSTSAPCLVCGDETVNVRHGKHLCCISCAKKHVRDFAFWCHEPLKNAPIYTAASDEDFRDGVRSFCSKLDS